MIPEQDNKKKRRAPVRRNIDARREQNRIASRNYREKRRQRLQLLDRLLEPVEGPLEFHDSLGTVDDATASVVQSRASEESVPSLPTLTPDDESLFSINQTPTPPLNSLPYFPEIDTFSNGTSNDALQSNHAWFPVTTIAPLSLSLPHKEPVAPASNSRSDGGVLAILNSISHLSHKQKKELMRHLQAQTEDSPVEALAPGYYAEAARRMPEQRFEPGNWVSRHVRRGATETRLQHEARRFAAFINQHASGAVSPAQLSRIYAAESALFAALFANCYALGMDDVEPLMGENGASVFCTGPDTGHEASQLPVVRARFSSLTQDLQPCDVQLTFGHHPYLDVLPWKSFRKRALEALQRDPNVLDEEELCHDICTGGLICWGAQQNSMGMEAGVPWDVRSWEPALWFLQKYQFLVGGWDDEMWKGARWWHQARGEKLRLPTPYILQDVI